MTFGTVRWRCKFPTLHVMATLSREQWLLNASGIAAVALVAWLGVASAAPWTATVTHGLFLLVFTAAAFDDAIGLPPWLGRLAMVALLLLTLLALVLHGDTQTLILAVVLAASAPYHLSARESWVLLIVGNIGFWLVLQAHGPSSAGFAYGFVTLLALQAFALSSSLARQRDAESRIALARQNNELQAARAVLARRSRDAERLRIAGDLHDTIGHGLTALQLQLEALTHGVEEGRRSQVQECKAVAAGLLEDVRAIVRDMAVDRGEGLADALAALAAQTPGVELDVREPLPAVDEVLERELVFCFQEGIHNALRHGHATRVTVSYADGAFRITDNGVGLRGRVVRPGFGIQNLGKRLAAFGGSATLESGPAGAGCTLVLRIGEGVFA